MHARLNLQVRILPRVPETSSNRGESRNCCDGRRKLEAHEISRAEIGRYPEATGIVMGRSRFEACHANRK